MDSRKARNGRIALPALALALLGSAAGHAAEVEWEANTGIGHSDNVGRSYDDKQSASMGSLGLRFALDQRSRRLETSASGDLAWLHYSEGAYDSEIVGSAGGWANLHLIEERLDWTVEDKFGQTRQDLFSAPSPDNREHLNYFATGPDLHFPLGSAASMSFGARFGRVDFGDGPGDSERIGGSFALARQLSRVTEASLNATHQRIEPRDASVTPTYDRSSAFARYATRGARSSFAVDAGANRVEGGGIDSNGALLRVELGRRVGAFSQVTVRLGNELTDSGAELGESGGIDSGSIPSSDAFVQDAAPYTQRYADVGWSATGRRTSITLSAAWFEEEYEEGSNEDRHRYFLGLTASRSLTPRLGMSAGAYFNRYKFSGLGSIDNDDENYNLTVSWRAGRRLSLEIAGEHSKYSVEGVSGEAAETRYWLRVRLAQQRNATSARP